jgi:Uma2 family endonuclease
VQEYWIVDSENSSVLIFRLREKILEETGALAGDDQLTSPLLPEFSIEADCDLQSLAPLPPACVSHAIKSSAR